MKHTLFICGALLYTFGVGKLYAGIYKAVLCCGYSFGLKFVYNIVNRVSDGIYSGIYRRSAEAGVYHLHCSLLAKLAVPLLHKPFRAGIFDRELCFSRKVAVIYLFFITQKCSEDSINIAFCLCTVAVIAKCHRFVHRSAVRHGIHEQKLIEAHSEYFNDRCLYLIEFDSRIIAYKIIERHSAFKYAVEKGRREGFVTPVRIILRECVVKYYI